MSEAAARSGRRPTDVLVVAVSKYAGIDEIRELIALGHADFGESKAQALVQRAAMIEESLGRQSSAPGVAAEQRAVRLRREEGEDLPSLPPAARVRWHMIGHLQRNKVRKVVGVARLIHSVDSLRLVEEIQAAAVKRDEVADILIQVNCSEERTKYGCAVAAALHLCEQAESIIHLRVRGLMTMAAPSDNPDDARAAFERCHELFEEARRSVANPDHFNLLSMGMSGDFEVAIECGSNLVRLGSSIFGQPAHPEPEEQDDDE